MPQRARRRGRRDRLLRQTQQFPHREAHAAQVRHVVKAVRSSCADMGIEEPPRLHDIVQAMLDALSERGVRLSRKEIAEAWARRHAAEPPEE